MTDRTTYLVDSDVFITAKNMYYAFDLCPGFWNSLLHYHGEGRIFSVDRVRNELLVGRSEDVLVQWVKNKVPRGFFVAVEDDIRVSRVYGKIAKRVQDCPRYFDPTKAKFATGADGWLVACALVRGAIVVTNERSSPKSKRDVKLPDVCDEFRVPRQDTFGMLRALGARFDWAGTHTRGKQP